MVFATGQCYQNDVCYQGVLSELVFATGQCYQNEVCYRGVLSKWYLLPGSVIRMMFATEECY